MNLTKGSENQFVLEQIVEQADEVFFIFDTSTRQFRYLSPLFDEVWEQERHLFASDPARLLQTIHPDDLENARQHWQMISQRINKPFECRILMPDGREKWVKTRTYNILNEDESMSVAGFCRDVSTDKEYIFTLQKYSSKKNSTLEILSHDLAGPLGIVQNLVTLVLDNAQQYQNPEIESDLHLIHETCSRSINLIRDLVNQEFLESANVDLKKERLDLVQKVGIIVDNYRQSERAVQKHFNLGASAPRIFAEVDDTKFMQVINNLISNAIKFTPDAGSINILIQEEPDHVLISVEDNGIGIPEEFKPVLFDRFTPARRTGLRGEPTVGLGMSIILRIVELHQGKIWLESRENQGTSIFVRIPKQ